MIQFKFLNPVQSFQGDSLLVTTEALGVPGTLWIDLTMKLFSGFKSVNPSLVIGKYLIYSLIFHYNIAMYKIFNKLNMIWLPQQCIIKSCIDLASPFQKN